MYDEENPTRRIGLNSCRLWTQKSVLLLFYSGIVKGLSWGKKTVTLFWALLAVTCIADIVVTFTGCHPFHHYWKILPKTGKDLLDLFFFLKLTSSPDRCTEAIVQLFVVGESSGLSL